MAEENKTSGESYQPGSQFTGLGDLLTHIGGNLKRSFLGEQYAWPDWDEKALGKPPMIDMPSHQGLGDIAEFNKILSNVSKMASTAGADELRNQLKALSGVSINIKDLEGNQNPETPPIGTPMVGERKSLGSAGLTEYTGTAPEMSFNPHVWGKYPVEGGRGEHGIATPEQMLIHELGHYAAIQKIYNDFLEKNSHSNTPIQTGPEEKNAYNYAINESHIVKDIENPAMLSVDPEYKKRDAARYSEGEILHAGKNGYPEVSEQDRASLIHVMKISGRPVPAELATPQPNKEKNADITKPASMLDQHSVENLKVNAMASEAVLARHSEEFAKEGATPSQLLGLKARVDEIIAINQANGTLKPVEIKVAIAEVNVEQDHKPV
ncbi:MAG: hypothetical protein WBL28_04270 [Methylotenera sp.]